MENIRDSLCEKMSPERSRQTMERISESSSKNSAASKTVEPMFLDLKHNEVDLLGETRVPSWETDIPSRGECLMHNFGESPNAVEESSLSQILEVNAPQKYYLSETACRGILRRCANRGKVLPAILLSALLYQGNVTTAEATEMGISLQPLQETTITE